MEAEAFYEQLDDSHFRATAATVGPWDDDTQHAGPPVALLGRAVQRCEQHDEMRVVRVTAEILGPVPVGDVEVMTRVARPGRSVELVEALLRAGGRLAIRANAWRMATRPGASPTVPPDGAPPELPEHTGTSTGRGLPGVGRFGYAEAIEWRFASGAFDELGPAQAWTRLRIPLVAGEATSGLCRVLAVADSGNGVSAAIDLREWLFVNTDLTVLLHRHPDDEWVCLESRTTLDPDGVGVAATVLSDRRGRLGHGLQSLLVRPR